MDLTGLSPSERTLLVRLAPFASGCTLDAVDEVLRTSWDHLDDPFDVLQSLVEKSLVLVEEPLRYRLLEGVRETIVDSVSPADAEVAMAGLFAWASGFCARVAEGTTGVGQEDWLDRCDLELENLRDAIAYGNGHKALRTRALGMAVDLRHFWAVRGHYALGRALVEPVLDEGDGVPDALRSNAANLVGVLALRMGDLETAERRLAESLALARSTGDEVAQGGVLVNLGMITWERMEFSSAREAFEEASIILRKANEWAKLGVALLNLGCVLIDMERLDEARMALEESLEPLGRGGNLGGLAFADGNLGYLALVRESRDEALRRIRASLDAFGRLGDWKGTMNTLISAATLLSATDLESAATIRGAIEAMSLKEGIAATPRDTLRLIEIDRTLSSAHGPRASWNKGLSMSPDDGIEYALSALMAITPEGYAPSFEVVDQDASRF